VLSSVINHHPKTNSRHSERSEESLCFTRSAQYLV
jgi:hypothetical protein